MVKRNKCIFSTAAVIIVIILVGVALGRKIFEIYKFDILEFFDEWIGGKKVVPTRRQITTRPYLTQMPRVTVMRKYWLDQFKFDSSQPSTNYKSISSMNNVKFANLVDIDSFVYADKNYVDQNYVIVYELGGQTSHEFILFTHDHRFETHFSMKDYKIGSAKFINFEIIEATHESGVVIMLATESRLITIAKYIDSDSNEWKSNNISDIHITGQSLCADITYHSPHLYVLRCNPNNGKTELISVYNAFHHEKTTHFKNINLDLNTSDANSMVVHQHKIYLGTKSGYLYSLVDANPVIKKEYDEPVCKSGPIQHMKIHNDTKDNQLYLLVACQSLIKLFKFETGKPLVDTNRAVRFKSSQTIKKLATNEYTLNVLQHNNIVVYS